MQVKQNYSQLFNDSFADSICWDPLIPGGSSEATRDIPIIRDQSLTFKPTSRQLFSTFGFSLILLFGITEMISLASNTNSDMASSVLYLFSLCLVVVIFKMISELYTPLLFDKNRGFYWRGYCKKDRTPQESGLTTFCSLDEIYAIQIISENCSVHQKYSPSSFKSYELNLVLKDSSRRNVIDHGKYVRMIKTANQISLFLNIPIWNIHELKE